MDDAIGREARAVHRHLARLVRTAIGRHVGGHLVEGRFRELELELALDLRVSESGEAEREFAERLAREVESRVDDAVREAAAFRAGLAFCHRCGGPACEHALPPSPRHVMAGYGTTGAPRWEELGQLCLDRRHPDVDRLFDDRPAFLTLVMDRDELHGGLLAAFEASSYVLLAQVVAGFFPVPAVEAEGRGVVALTFQIGASRGARGSPSLALNVLGRAPGNRALESLWERQRELSWRRAARWAQTALGTVPTRRVAESAVEARAVGIARGLARRLERGQRGAARRTRHADLRHQSGRRPTRMAMEDVRRARPDDLWIDERASTVVVVGERGRAHFFNPEGRHVSSVRYSRDAISRKIKVGVWRAATPAEIDRFRSGLDPETAESGRHREA